MEQYLMDTNVVSDISPDVIKLIFHKKFPLRMKY